MINSHRMSETLEQHLGLFIESERHCCGASDLAGHLNAPGRARAVSGGHDPWKPPDAPGGPPARIRAPRGDSRVCPPAFSTTGERVLCRGESRGGVSI